jgi:uncharacterized protein YhaN
LVRQYDAHARKFDGALMGYVAGVHIRYNLGQGQSEDPLERLNEAQIKEAQRLKNQGMEAAIKLEAVPDKVLRAEFKDLFEKGYITIGDFGFFPYYLVQEAHDRARIGPSQCPPPQA